MNIADTSVRRSPSTWYTSDSGAVGSRNLSSSISAVVDVVLVSGARVTDRLVAECATEVHVGELREVAERVGDELLGALDCCSALTPSNTGEVDRLRSGPTAVATARLRRERRSWRGRARRSASRRASRRRCAVPSSAGRGRGRRVPRRCGRAVGRPGVEADVGGAPWSCVLAVGMRRRGRGRGWRP